MKFTTHTLSSKTLSQRDECISLIAAAQGVEGARCLHSDFDVSASTYLEENPNEHVYVVAFADELPTRPLAILGAEIADDLKRAWLRGPFFDKRVTAHEANEIARALFKGMQSEAGTRAKLWDAYIETSHATAMDGYTSLGFFVKGKHSVFTVTREDAKYRNEQAASFPKSPEIVDAITELASPSFPGGYLTRDEFGAPPSDEAVTLCICEGNELLGYVYASYAPGAIEAQIDNIAVAPHVRRCGIGRKLVNAALHWAFATRNAPQVALVVRDGNTNARALYESVGFCLLADGTHLRLDTTAAG
jgi:[ribosomal protein S18]-alanine N-acetyltransferase